MSTLCMSALRGVSSLSVVLINVCGGGVSSTIPHRRGAIYVYPLYVGATGACRC